jgi:PAS domain S-box-containing protein
MSHRPEIATRPRRARGPRSENRMRVLFDNDLAGIFRVSWEGIILDCNDAFAHMLGVASAADLRGRSVLDFYNDPADRARNLAQLEHDTTLPVREVCLRRPDGTIIWVLASASRISGQTSASDIAGTVIDITPRKRAVDALLESEGRFRSVVHTAGSAIMCLDLEQRITEFNPAAERVFGRRREDVIGRDYTTLLPAAVREKVRDDLRRVAAGDAIADFENVVARPGGTFAVLLWNIQSLADSQGRRLGVVAVGQDITERLQAEESLLRQRRYLRVLSDTDRAILALQKPETIAAAVLQHIEVLLPCRGAAVIAYDFEAGEARLLAARGDPGGPVVAARPLTDRDFGDDPAAGVEGAAGRSLALPLVAQGLPIGLLQINELSGPGPVTSSEAELARHVASSETELASHVADRLAVALQNARLFEGARDARLRLEAVSVRLVDVQESERRRIARELHDEVGQALTGLKLQLEMAAAQSGPSAGLGQACSIVQRLIEQVRDLSLDLRPAMLDDLGLVPALLWHIERYTARTGVHIRFVHHGLGERFAANVETASYRIVQEALTNVARHARTHEAVVRARRTATDLELEISDRGIGFDPAATDLNLSTGVSSMRERTTLLGGTFRITSAPDAGTTVRASLPLDRTPKRQTPDVLARARTAYERARRRRSPPVGRESRRT